MSVRALSVSSRALVLLLAVVLAACGSSTATSSAGETSFADLVHGPVRFDRAHIDDFVLLRSDGKPTYHLSVVVETWTWRSPRRPRRRPPLDTPKHIVLFAPPVPRSRPSRTCR